MDQDENTLRILREFESEKFKSSVGLAKRLGMYTPDASQALRGLVLAGLLEKHGAGRAAQYRHTTAGAAVLATLEQAVEE